MPNLKFSQFQEQTDPANVQFVVGYNGTDNVRITPGNLGGYPFLIDTASLYSGFVPSGLSGNPQGNTVLGISASSSATTGVNNTALGYQALSGNTTGGYNTAVGNNALSAAGISNYNTAVGNAAGRLTTGDLNTFLGEQAGEAVTSGRDNVFIGALAGYQNTSTTINSILIGYNTNTSPVGQSNFIVLGNSSHTTLQIPGIQSGASDGDVLTYNATLGKLELQAAGGSAGLVSGAGSDSMASDASLTPSGNPAIASGVRSIALGADSPFAGTNAQCEANSQDAIAIGTSAFASGINGVSIGNLAKSRSSDVTIGNNSGRYTSSGSNNVRIGNSASQFSSTFSVYIGNQSGQNANNGNYNVAVGADSLKQTTGNYNVGIGASAGRSNTADYGVHIGSEAGYSQTSGTGNTNLGYQAGYSNTINNDRTTIGYQAGYFNTGASNTFIGRGAGYGVSGASTGEQNTAIGTYALNVARSGLYNTAIGWGAGMNMTTGQWNTLIGRSAGNAINNGEKNVVIGVNANVFGANAQNQIVIGQGATGTANNQITLGDTNITALRIPGLQSGASDGDVLTFSSATGDITLQAAGGGGATDLNGLSDCLVDTASLYVGEVPSGIGTHQPQGNTVLGIEAGDRLLNGSQNTIFGNRAAYWLSTMRQCSFFGFESGENQIGDYNTGVGYQSLNSQFGYYDGDYCVALGYRAMYHGSDGDKNVGIGHLSFYNRTMTGSNNIAIGSFSAPSSNSVSNEITLGDSNIATLRCAVTSITSLSDERDKSEIKDLEYGLAFIDALQPREFVWDNRPEIRIETDDEGNETEVEFYSANKGKKDFGFIAQEVRELDNDTLRLVYAENEDKLEMSYGKLVPILVKAVQELKAEIEILKSQNN